MKGLHRNLAIAVLIIGGFLFAQSDAATFTVNSTVDAVDVNPGDGLCETANASECTLRAAIQETNALVGSDVVTLPAGTYVLNVGGWREDAASTGDLDVTDDLSIVGAGAGSTVIDGNKGDRIFDVFPPAQVSISFLSIQNGDLNELYFPEHGGGIRNLSVLTLGGVDVSNNNANTDMGNGGGIFNTGDLYLTDVAISGNMASTVGGLANFGQATLDSVTINGNASSSGVAGMHNDESASAMLTNVTISGNVGGGSTTSGGGFRNMGAATLVNVTITANSGPYGAGISLPITGPFSPVTDLSHTLVAGNIGRDCWAWGIVSSGYNLDGDDTCGLTGPGDIVNVDPLLAPLRDNGGFTLTHELLAGSPAIDAGGPGCPPPSVDQRGERRPIDGNSDGLIICDIGAYERQSETSIDIIIDVLPKDDLNSVNLSRGGSIKVAILSMVDFLAPTEVNPYSVEFGPAAAKAVRYKVKDVDRDGLSDLLLYFLIKETGIECGESEVILTGETYDGALLEGTDSILTKGCK